MRPPTTISLLGLFRFRRWMAVPPSLAVFLLLLLGATSGGAATAAEPAPHASTAAERQTRGEEAARAFMVGRYEDALATYLDLYIQSDGRPEYLRNIGRCQQKLKQYSRAIESFKDYLRRARRLSADERKEVQGFIAEMQAALASDNAAPVAAPAWAPPAAPTPATPAPSTYAPPRAIVPIAPPLDAPPPAAPVPAPPAPNPPSPYAYAPAPPAATYPPYPPYPPAYAAPPAPAAPPPPELIAHGPEAGAAESHTSPVRVAGIVSLIAAGAAAIGGTIGLVRAKSTFDDAAKAGCPGGNSKSYCDDKATSVANANTLSKIFYVAAGALGIAGITMIAASPSATPDGRVSLGVSGRF